MFLQKHGRTKILPTCGVCRSARTIRKTLMIGILRTRYIVKSARQNNSEKKVDVPNEDETKKVDPADTKIEQINLNL